MDAFFASVEQRDNPQYRGKPLVVSGYSDRSVVAAASYEARQYGIRSAMPFKTALRRCSHLINIPPHFSKYKEISNQIREIFLEYTDLVEPLSLDEAFLDVTEPKRGKPSASLIAKEIKFRIYERTGLIASAGVSYNKFLAKIASDQDKPNGFFLIKPEDAEAFMDTLKIEQFFGVGKVTAKKFHRLGIATGADLREWSKQRLVAYFGRIGAHYYSVVRGIDERPVVPDRTRKSIGVERTFMEDVSMAEDVKIAQEKVLDELWKRFSSSGKKGKTVTVKVKFSNFEIITRRETLENYIESREQVAEAIKRLTPLDMIEERRCRLLGATISGFSCEGGGDQLKCGQLRIEF